MPKNKILITGSAGFIGYHLCKSLLKDNCEVLGIDNMNNYYDVNLKNSRLNDLTNNEKPVFTVSTSQVRNSINRKGIGKWKKYGALINNFREKISKI